MRSVILGDLDEEGDNPDFINDDFGAQVLHGIYDKKCVLTCCLLLGD